LDQRTPVSQVSRFRRILKKIWKPKNNWMVLKTAIGRALIRDAHLHKAQVRYGIRAVRDWWPRARLYAVLNEAAFGTHFLTGMLNSGIRDQVDDVALSAASRLAEIGLKVDRPLKSLNIAAAMSLRQTGVISRLPRTVDGVEKSLKALLGQRTGVSWRSVFGKSYKQAEKQAVFCRALAETNATAFVNATDVFNDLLLSRLYRHDRSLGTYTLGSMGSILTSTRLKSSYPSTFNLILDVHERRYVSSLSHPVARRTGKPTGRIKFSYLKRAKRLMRSAFAELAARW
jgi:hypothetical protein